jgi:AcrR family transcriptional regulator
VIDPWVKTRQALAVEPDRRLTAQGLERKQQLIDCAAVLFAERGYAETRVIDIVRAAGVAKGLFYWYFENKEALFKDLAENIRLQLRREQGKVLDSDALPLVNLYRGAQTSVLFMAEHAHFFSMLEVEGRNFGEVMREGTRQHIDDMVRIVRAGQADGTIREDDPRLLAVGVVACVGQFSHFHRNARIRQPLPELAAFVGRYVVHSLAADDHASDTALRTAQALTPSPL